MSHLFNDNKWQDLNIRLVVFTVIAFASLSAFTSAAQYLPQPITPTTAQENSKPAITELISKQEFLQYKNVADFIDASPKVTITVAPEPSDIKEYGTGVVKTLTGSDCDRDGEMDDNPTCNAVYYKLWLKYQR